MEKSFSLRQIWIGFLSLLLVWWAVFLLVHYLATQPPALIAWENLRSRLWTLTTHKSVQWKNRLQSRPYKQHMLKSSRSFTLPQWAVISWWQAQIPASSWTLFIEWTSNYNDTQWSWIYFFTLQWTFFSWTNEPISWDTLHPNPETVLFSWSIELIRSGNDVRSQLHSVSVTQQSWMNTFLLIAWAYIKQYEKTRLHINNLEQSRIDLIQWNIYNRLALQEKQHIIPSHDWSVKIILEWENIQLDSEITSHWLLQWTLQFWKRYALRFEEMQEDNKILITLFSEKQKKSLWDGYLWLDTSDKKLVLTSNVWWNIKETLLYSWTISNIFTAWTPFTLTIPTQSREWSSIRSNY